MRRLWLLLEVMSLLGAVLTAAMWVCSFHTVLIVQIGWLDLAPLDGKVYFALESGFNWRFLVRPYDLKDIMVEVVLDASWLPCWLLVLLFSGAGFGFYRLGRRGAIPPGHCRQCGYDLRASPGKCPECGAAAEPAGA